jgi:hypothetical protein
LKRAGVDLQALAALSIPLPQSVGTCTSTINRVRELIVRLTTDGGFGA